MRPRIDSREGAVTPDELPEASSSEQVKSTELTDSKTRELNPELTQKQLFEGISTTLKNESENEPVINQDTEQITDPKLNLSRKFLEDFAKTYAEGEGPKALREQLKKYFHETGLTTVANFLKLAEKDSNKGISLKFQEEVLKVRQQIFKFARVVTRFGGPAGGAIIATIGAGVALSRLSVD